MNLESEKFRLIDFSSEDDFLIDSQLDSSFLDLRLSVACETQNELTCNQGRFKLRACPGENDPSPPLSSFKEQETFQLKREQIDSEFSLRKSLAWDSAFFTNPGILDLEELCLVNRGLKNPQSLSSCVSGTDEIMRSKICMERNSSLKLAHKPALQAGSRQRTQSLINAKLTSPSKVMLMQDSKPQYKNTRSSSSAIPKSTTYRRESLMSTRRTCQNIVSTTHTKKPPCKTLNSWEISTKERLAALKSRRPDSLRVSSQSALSLIASSNSVDFSPYRNCSYDTRSPSLKKSPVTQGECPLGILSPTCGSRKTIDLEASPLDSSNRGLTNDVNVQTEGSQVSRGKGLLRQSATRAARRSPVFADTQRSSKPSSLRKPSQKIGFFDMKSEASEPQSTCSEVRDRNSLRSSHSKEDEPTNKLKDQKSKKSATWNKSKMSNESLETGVKDERRRNQHKHKHKHPCETEKQTSCLIIEEKENIFHPEDTVTELEIKHDSPLPLKSGAKTSGQCSSSSGKHLPKTRRPIQQTKPSLASTRIRIPFSTKGSPLKRSAFF